MEILELQKRINDTLEHVNNAKSISEKRRYFVYLSGLVAVYNELTNSELQLGHIGNGKIMKYTFYESLIKLFNENCENIYNLSSGVLQTRKEVGCDFRLKFNLKTYSPKYMMEVVDSFIASLGPKYYKIYHETLKNDLVFFTKDYAAGLSVFDYQKLRAFVFVPRNKQTLAFLTTFAHEFGHVFEYDYTKFSRKAFFTNRYNVNIEVFSMFIELLLFDYLKSIHFNSNEVNKMEEKFYNDVIGYASGIKFALSLSNFLMDYNCNLVICDYKEAYNTLNELQREVGITYYIDDVNLADSINYMYGGLIATIYRYYYNQDSNFIKEIEKHFLDYESYTTEEILDRLPFVREEFNDFKILRKKLEQIKTNQF